MLWVLWRYIFMKIKGNYLHSLAFGLAYLCAMQTHTLSAMQAVFNTVSDNTYCASYVTEYLIRNWWTKPIYTYQKPISIPKELPTPDQIARGIAANIEPQKFMRGASTSAHQCEKQCTAENCDWARWAEQHKLPKPTDKRYKMDWDKHYKNYIDFAKDELKLNALRFSVEWAVVQPKDDTFNRRALDRYADIFCYMIKRGITPIVCFHHYTNPCWFTDQGAFEKPENIDFFVNYCSKVYAHFMKKLRTDKEAVAALQKINAPLWATYNAPAGYAFRGYRQKAGPPSIRGRSGLGVVAEVLKNMLEAHVRVYQNMKQTYRNMELATHDIDAPQIGFLKNIHQVEPSAQTWMAYCASPLTRFLLSFADMIQNGSIYNFFTTGIYQVHIPFKANIKHVNLLAPDSIDFVGLNYYANRSMCLTKGIKPTNQHLCSDNQWYYRYPQGIYRAIIELQENMNLKARNIPMFVAENGIATQDEEKRARFYHEYLYAISRAIGDGYKVYGYCPWTFFDNYEWPALNDNTVRNYGLCAVKTPSQLEVKEGTRKSYLAFNNELATLEQTV